LNFHSAEYFYKSGFDSIYFEVDYYTVLHQNESFGWFWTHWT